MGSPAAAVKRFSAFAAEHCGLDVEPFQKRIARAHYAHRETLVLLPRGNGKSTLAAALALHHLTTTRRPQVIIAASSRDQARVLHEAARDMVIDDPWLAERVDIRWRELRASGGTLRCISSDAGKAHGLAPTLVIADELHTWPAGAGSDLYVALRTALGKRDARLLCLTTAGHDHESLLGRLRARGLELGRAQRRGPLTATSDGAGGLALLEWAMRPDAEPLDLGALAAANPASFVTRDWLREQVQAPGLAPWAVARLHGNRWTAGEAQWLPAGAWEACRDPDAAPDESEVIIAIDVGGTRSQTVVLALTTDLRVAAVHALDGDEAAIEAAAIVQALAHRYTVREVVYDPWRWRAEALRLEADGFPAPLVEFQQSNARMVPASEQLYAAVTERRLRHPANPVLDRHVHAARARQTPRGWRLEKSTRGEPIDAAVCLAMAVERAQAGDQAHAAELLGVI